MKSQAEFDMTLNLPCSVGILAHDIECSVTVDYETQGKRGNRDLVGWKLVAVKLDEKPGLIEEGDPVFFLFKEAMADKSNHQIIRDECLDHADDEEPERDAA